CAPGGLTRRLSPGRMRQRFHPQLAGADVRSHNVGAIAFEARHRRGNAGPWDVIMRRNAWFQDRVVTDLRRLAERNPGRHFCLFSYSYTARRPFEFARDLGWTTVLGQIDPGPPEERVVARAHQQHPELNG